MVNTERMKRTFTELVSLYAPSKGEREVCEYLKKKLKSLGASKIIEDNDGSVNGGNCGNLIAVWNGNAPGLPSIALTAHMDCVEHCKDIEPILEGGVFTSKGDTILGGDDKAGVTAILEGIALMKEMYIPHGKITVIFTVQEEIGLFGSKYIEEKYIQGIDFGYVLDADGPAGSLYNAGPSWRRKKERMRSPWPQRRSHAARQDALMRRPPATSAPSPAALRRTSSRTPASYVQRPEAATQRSSKRSSIRWSMPSKTQRRNSPKALFPSIKRNRMMPSSSRRTTPR